MKSFIVFALVASTSAFAVSGTSLFEDVRGTSRSTIHVAGNTAQMMFEGLSDQNMTSVDASETPDGRRRVWKEGINYNCELAVGSPTRPSQYKCSIPFSSKSRGTVGIAGLAYPRSNSGITNTPGTSTVVLRPYQNESRQALTLSIYGAAAERAYNLLNVRTNDYGQRRILVREEADNISCAKRTQPNTPVRYSCELLIESKSTGRITHPGVG